MAETLTPARCILFALAGVLLTAAPVTAERVTLNFNPDWRFVRDDPAGAQTPGFDDSGWTVVHPSH